MSETVANFHATLSTSQLAVVRRRAILSCAIGNFFELFDFTIYGYFAVAITRAFYPSGSMYGTYAAFGAAFLMRPVGAIVIGAYGDRVGRRAALVVTIGIMACATGAVGLIPTYTAIGYWAPVLLVLCRLAAGLLDRRRMGRGSGIPGGVFATRQARPDRKLAAVQHPDRRADRLALGGAAGVQPQQRRFLRLGLAHPVPLRLRSGPDRLLSAQESGGDAGLRTDGRDQNRRTRAVAGGVSANSAAA